MVQARAREASNAARNAAIGKFKILKDEGSGPIDVSSQNIAQITANIAELDLILADYDAAPRSIPIDQLNASNDE